MITRIKGRWVVGWDPERRTHVLIEGGEVAYEDDRIVYVGRHYEGEAHRVVDATGCLVSPGFINGHALMDVAIAQYGFDRPREEGMYRPRTWLEDPQQTSVFTPEEIRAGAESTLLGLARSGSTTFLGITAMVFKRWDDPEWEPEIYAQTARKFGLRAYLSHHFRDGAGYLTPEGKPAMYWNHEQGRKGLERNIAFIKRLQASPDDMIRGLIFPYTLDQNSADLLKEARRASRELGVGIRMHFAQSLYEVAEIWARHRATPVEHLDSLGFLGPDVLLTHCLYLAGNHGTPYPDGRELRLLAERGVNVCNTPWIYAERGGYLNAFGRYLRAGVNMLIGTDTFPQDIIREMRYAMVMGKAAENSASAVTARDAFNAVTVNAARFLGRDDIGRLEPGAKADLVLVDFDRVGIGPSDDPIRSLIYFGSMNDVRTVVVNGKTVVDGFRAIGVDEAEVVRKAQPVSDKIKETFVRWDWAGRRPEERFAPSFPRV